jgi:hypothetical protein
VHALFVYWSRYEDEQERHLAQESHKLQKQKSYHAREHSASDIFGGESQTEGMDAMSKSAGAVPDGTPPQQPKIMRTVHKHHSARF